MGDVIDWDLAVRVGSRLAGDGPVVSSAEAADVVAELREDAARSTALVREHTGLDAPENTAPVLVVDRRGWVQANADAFAAALAPLVDRVTSKRMPGPVATAIGSRVTGLEVGGLLGFLGGKVLGQFDPFHEPHGRLLLVAPNIVHVERELGAVPGDFRLWVCLHEETHRVQFTANPWLREHLFAQITALADTMDVASILDDGLKRVSEAIRGRGQTGSLVDLVSSPEQKQILDRVTGMMSLLEGHADVVMDSVGPEVIPSVEAIRRKFDKRRKGVGTLDRLLRRILGLDAKMAQYRDGAKFVRRVVARTGMEQFNAVFAGPDNLPSTAEIHDPDAWIRRVL
ncbi:zinc-dependent metalloprotease [Nocardioides sp. CER19]|uniref:zinc-dependent metalloprotease n=1 Tax=Nocardioides sp. CER19 TaxID=3038538 RepID=UPI00244A15B3|nr:zinc-dependent metalloprotease [Nocardioides sp. CER19]MDH2414206.1 zinc-dependent metalloprotease [Nocardioides sp. CER19]